MGSLVPLAQFDHQIEQEVLMNPFVEILESLKKDTTLMAKIKKHNKLHKAHDNAILKEQEKRRKQIAKDIKAGLRDSDGFWINEDDEPEDADREID